MRAKRHLWLALATCGATCGATGAAADVKAVYGQPDRPAQLTLEASDTGDVRVETPDSIQLRRGGEDFLVLPGPGGPIVLRETDVARIRAAQPAPTFVMASPKRAEPRLVAMGKRAYAGFTGDAYGYPASMKDGPAVVVSDDPRLAPLKRADAVRRAMGERLALYPREASGERAERVAETGAPLFIWPMPLQEIQLAPVPPARFMLPAEPLSSAEVTEQFGLDRPPEPDDSDSPEQTAFKRVVGAGGEVWLLTDGGRLSMLDRASGRGVPVTSPPAVVEACAYEGGLVALTLDGKRWTARRRAAAGWTVLGGAATGGERLVAMNCDAGRVTVLTTKRLLVLAGEGAGQAVALAEDLSTRSVVVVTAIADGKAVWVGLNAGEWGGGLHRIERATGQVTTIESAGATDDAQFGGGSPVNGLAFQPGKPGCLLAAVGLVHFTPSGVLFQVCDTRVERVLQVPYTMEPGGATKQPVYESVPFYGLATVGDAVWAVTSSGLYRIAADGTRTFQRLPRMRRAGGITSSLDVAGVALVYSSINGRVSVTGAAPVIAAR